MFYKYFINERKYSGCLQKKKILSHPPNTTPTSAPYLLIILGSWFVKSMS